MPLNGMRVIESIYLTQDGEPYEARRSWHARLFSRPWRPWRATYRVVPKIPYQGAVQIDDHTLVMHPYTLQQLMAQELYSEYKVLER